MMNPSSVTVRFTDELLSQMEAAYSAEGIDRSEFIRKCVREYFGKKDKEQALPGLLVNQCEYLKQITNAGNWNDFDLFRQEVERLWDIVQWWNKRQFAKS